MASRGLVKETSLEPKEDDFIVDETCPSGGVVSEMTAGFAVAVKTRLSFHGQQSQRFRGVRFHSSVRPIGESVHTDINTD